MANYDILKTSVSDVIKTNGKKEITGALLQQTLMAMINSLGTGYQFVGVATPETNPGTPDAKVFYIADGKGSYTHFGELEVTEDEVVVLYWDSLWHKESTGIAREENLTNLERELATKANIQHQHTVADITDFPELYYDATAFFTSGAYPSDKYEELLEAVKAKRTVYATIDEAGHISYVFFMSSANSDGSSSRVLLTTIFADGSYLYLNTFVLQQSGMTPLRESITGKANKATTLAGYGIADAYTKSELDALLKGKQSILTDTDGSYGQRVANLEKEGIASQEKLTELDEKIRGIHFSEEKTFNSASSILYFSNVGLHSGDKIYVKISGTALWSTAWLYGDAGTTIGSKILLVKQNNTYEITLTSDTNTIGLRIYDLSSAGDVRIDLTKKKGELDLLYGYTDSKTEGLKIVGLDKGYEVISWDVLIADKYIQSLHSHPSTGADYNLIKLHCKAGDLLRITNIVASIGTAVLSICSSSFIGDDNQLVIPIIISQQNAATNYDWEAPFDCDIVICYYTTSTPVITKFSSPLVERVAVAENLSWQGKTVVCFGDSLTEFTGNGQGYGDWIARFTGANVICVGIGGGELRQRTIPVDNPTNNNAAYAALDIYNMVKSSCEQDFTKQIAAANWLRDNVGDDNTAIIQRLVDIDWSKVDAVTILGGTNDWHNSPDFFGESGSTDANYTLGAINEIIRLLTSTYKHISLYWFTTIVRYNTPSGTSIIDARVHENWSDVWQNLAGMTLKDTIQPIIAEVSNNKIPVCDMYNTLGWNEHNFSQYFNIDNTHPYNGYEQMAKKMIGFINANRTF